MLSFSLRCTKRVDHQETFGRQIKSPNFFNTTSIQGVSPSVLSLSRANIFHFRRHI